MVTKTTLAGVVLLLVGCGGKADQATIDTVMVFTATPPPAPNPTAPISAQAPPTVPDQFRGIWAGSHAKCGIPSESSLAIDADRIDFYESRGRVLEVKVIDEREAEVLLESSGEGQVSRSTRRFRLSAGGDSLTDVTTRYQTVRVRCKNLE